MTDTTEKKQGPVSELQLDRLRQAAEILLHARRDLQPIDNLPAELRPRSLEEAYALQFVMAEAFAPIGGWKIGASSPDATPLTVPCRSGEATRLPEPSSANPCAVFAV